MAGRSYNLPRLNRNEGGYYTPYERPPKRKKKIFIGEIDYIILLCVTLLVAFGVVMVFSSSYYTAGRGNGDMYSYLKKELAFAAVGFVAMFAASKFPHELLKRFVRPGYLISCILLILVLTPLGIEHNGAKRWLKIGFEFQPSEIAKIVLIITLATLLTEDKNLFRSWKDFARYLVIIAVPCGLVALENLSTAIVMGAVSMVMLFVYTTKFQYFLVPTVAGVAGVLVMIFGSWRSDRVQAWLHPETVANDKGYQVLQSLYSIASGGMFGLGIGGSRQKLGYMPEAHNDIIFAIICEELGWFGAAIIIGIFIVLIWRGVYIAIRQAKEPFSMLLATGITTMIAVQVIINIAVVTNTIPNTGIPLPFISYGGTSLVMMLASMGVLMNISRYHGSNSK